MGRIIVSVPHCGTRFLMSRLNLDQWAHTHWQWGRILETIGNRDVIVPLREPVNVWASWCKYNDPDNFPYAEFFLAWAQLDRLANTLQVDVINIETKTDKRINDWQPVGHFTGKYPTRPVDLRSVYDLTFVARHFEYTGDDFESYYYRKVTT